MRPLIPTLALLLCTACLGSRSRLPKTPPQGPTAGLGGVTVTVGGGADVEVEDLDGRTHTPLKVGVAQAHVLLFVTTDCPIANAYAPEIRRLVHQYGPRGVVFYAVHVFPDLRVEDAAAHARDYELPPPIVLDREHRLVAAVGATRTPEAAVVLAGGRMVYRGRIDDLFAELGVKRPAGASCRDLRQALDEVLAGREVSEPRQPAIGCDIPHR